MQTPGARALCPDPDLRAANPFFKRHNTSELELEGCSPQQQPKELPLSLQAAPAEGGPPSRCRPSNTSSGRSAG